MAQDGDTITYTYNGTESFAGPATEYAEDISSVGEIVVEYIDASGGRGAGAGAAGGRVKNLVADVSSYNTLYIWVSGENANLDTSGRYNGDTSTGGLAGGASSEISVLNTDQTDSDTEPFIAAAGGGGGAQSSGELGNHGARHDGIGNTGISPPQGGDGQPDTDSSAEAGYGAVSGHGSAVSIKDSGSTVQGGGSPAGADGEIKLSFQSPLSPPDPPSNLTTTVQ
jgi:hypothetical protein